MRKICNQENYNLAARKYADKILDSFYKDGDNCWIWFGPEKDGYGSLNCVLSHKTHNRGLRAHRLVYTLLIAEVPESLVLDHVCRNTICVNPYHLDVVHESINIQRGLGIGMLNAKKNTCPYGHPYVDTPNNKRGRLCLICTKRGRDKFRGKSYG